MGDSTSSFSLRIFVVENHEETLMALARYLRRLGHTVEHARTMTEALALIPLSQPEVLLSDIGLPDGDGWRLMCEVDLPSSVFAVAMSGFCRPLDQEKSRAVGYQMHLLKPFTQKELGAMLEAAARHKGSSPP